MDTGYCLKGKDLADCGDNPALGYKAIKPYSEYIKQASIDFEKTKPVNIFPYLMTGKFYTYFPQLGIRVCLGEMN